MAVNPLLAQERRIGVPSKWVLFALGALALWTAPGQSWLNSGLPPGLPAYGLVALLATLVFYGRSPRRRGGQWLCAMSYAADIAFMTYLIGPSGGLASPFYLLYGPLALKAALYAPWLRGVFLVPFALGPLYVIALGVHTGNVGFLADRQFLLRYGLLFAWTLAASVGTWALGQRQVQVATLQANLGDQAQALEQKTQVLQRTATDLGDRVLQLRSLQEVARALASTLRLEETLHLIAEELAELSGASHSAVALLEPENNTLAGVIAVGPGQERFREFRLPLYGRSESEGAIARALHEGRVVTLDVANAMSGTAPDQLRQMWGAAPCLLAPLIVRGRLIGALLLAGEAGHGPVEKAQQLTSSFAYFAATAIENARLYQTVWEKSRELETVLEGIGDGVVVADRQMQLLLMNPVATALFGLEAAPPAGVPLALILPSSPFLALLEETLAGEHDIIRELELSQAGDTTQTRTYQALASRMLDAASQVRGVVAVLRDVTAQKDLERMKSNFLSVMSHELRTPLHSIKGFVDIILMGKTGPVTETQRDFLTTVQQQTGHLQRLIDDLLEFSRMEAGQVKLRIGPVPLRQIAAQVVSKLTPLAGSAGLHIVNSISPDFPTIEGDQMRLEQVLTNLMENAVKFTPQGGSVTVGGEERDAQVHLWVQDTGIGIPPAELERIFDRFYQVDGGANRLYRGTGLGLTICRHIIAHHRGQIWAESDGQHGSTFHFILPKRLAVSEAAMNFTTLPEDAHSAEG
ncbi:MAG: PAS domain-containing protein [Anaerolineae bacterium]|nr:PAS domain-containing protein [Anaerolineae bacterium]